MPTLRRRGLLWLLLGAAVLAILLYTIFERNRSPGSDDATGEGDVSRDATNGSSRETGSAITKSQFKVGHGGRPRTLHAHDKPVVSLSISHSGARLLSADTQGKIAAWDFHAGVPLVTIAAPSLGLRRAEFTSDGAHVLGCGGDPPIRMWDAKTGEMVRQFSGHNDVVSAIRGIPGKRQFVSASFDSALIVWDLATGDAIRRFGRATNAQDAAPQTADDLARLDGHFTWIRDIVVLPDRSQAISAGNDAVLFLWDLDTGALVKRLVGHRTVIMGLAVAPDGRTVASVGNDKEIIVWEIDTGRIIRRWEHSGEEPAAICFLRDSRALAISGQNGCIRIGDAATGTEYRRLETGEEYVTALAVTPDGEIVSGFANGMIKIWPAEASP